MTIADRIQTLRKAKGISQEELADRMGVSRQAVSKWESEQSSPDLDKVILLSDYFEVTTDYLLKGIEQNPDFGEERNTDAGIFTAVATAVNFIGLIAAVMIWIEEQTSAAVAAGFILFAVGCMLYALGQIIGKNKARARRWFFLINVWILLLMPVTCIFNFAEGVRGRHWWTLTPFPQISMTGSMVSAALCWLCYILCCAAVDAAILKRSKKGNGKRL